MASFESMSDVELRKKLVEHGFDIPVAGNRDFIIKKLTKLQEGTPVKGRGGRKSTPVVSSRPTPPPATNNGGGTPSSRLSLNESGLRRSASKESDRLPPPAATKRGGSARRSVGSAVETSSNKSSSSATGRQRNSLPPPASSASSSRLRQVVETVEDEEESSSEDDSLLVDGSMNGDHDEVEEMEVEEIRPSQRSALFNRAPLTPYRSTKVTNNISSRTITTALPTSFTTTTTSRAGLLTPSPYSANNTSNNSSPTKSSRFEKYYNYFRNDTDSRQDGDPMLFSFSRTPGGGLSPSSTAATVGSPSFNRSYPSTSLMSEDCSADEEEEDFETEGEGMQGRWFSKLNPLNLVRGLWRRKSEDAQTDLNSSGDEYGSDRAFSQQSSPVSSLGSAGRYSYSTSSASGLHIRGPASAAVAQRLYSPAARVPPAMAAGRQAGFQLFSSRGERNGVGSGSGLSSDSTSNSTNIPKLIVISILTMFLFIGVGYYAKSMNGNNGGDVSIVSSPASDSPAKKTGGSQRIIVPEMNYCICTAGADSETCVPKVYIRQAKELLDKLKSELVQRSAWKGCSGDDKLNFVSAKKVAAGLMSIKMSDVEPLFRGALILINENPTYGLKIDVSGKEDDELTTREVLELDPETSFITAVGVRPNIMCLLWAGVSNLVFYCGCFAVLAVIGYASCKYLMIRRSRKKLEEEELFQTVQEVIEMLREQQERSQANNSIEGYLAINHIRDTLIPAQQRKKKEALWKAVVNHISTQESRVREEVQHLSGEEYQVWRWMAEASPLPSPTIGRRRPSATLPPTSPPPSGSGEGSSAGHSKLYPSLEKMATDLNNLSGNGEDLWQGQAFEVNAGSPNALMKIPSTCLKIRQMYDPARGADEERRVIIGRAVQLKCGASKILHIGIDPRVSDGSVYLLCQSKEDARAAFSALHGWWFEGNLLSVKFLREERYFERFPDARVLYIPCKGISGQGSFRDQLRTGFN